MQSCINFTCVLTLAFTFLDVLAIQEHDSVDDTRCSLVQLQMSTSRDNKHQLRDVTNNLVALHNKILLLQENKKSLSQQLKQVESQHTAVEDELKHQQKTCSDELKSQQKICSDELKSQEDAKKMLQLETEAREKLLKELSISRKLTEELTLENEILKLQLKESQSCKDAVVKELTSKLDLLKEFSDSGKAIEKLTRENAILKHQLEDSHSCKDTVLKELASKLEAHKSAVAVEIKTEANNVKSFINLTALQLGNQIIENTKETIQKLDFNTAKVVLAQSQVAANIIIINKLINEEQICQTQNKEKLTQILTKLEGYDKDLTLHRKLSTELLGTTTLYGKRYFFSYEQPYMSWYEADDFCKSHGMELVSVETQREWNVLKPEVLKLKNKIGQWPWSSGTDAAEEGKWTWAATGNDATFFVGGTTSNSKTNNCLYLYTEYWDDQNCSFKKPFICEVNSSC